MIGWFEETEYSVPSYSSSKVSFVVSSVILTEAVVRRLHKGHPCNGDVEYLSQVSLLAVIVVQD